MKRSLILAAVLGALLPAGAGCAATGPRDGASAAHDAPYERLAAELCASAELRVDLSAMRVLVDHVRPRAYSAAAVAHRHVAVVDAELRFGLEYALASRLHLVGPDPYDRVGLPPYDDPLEMAQHYGATHVFAANYDTRGKELDVAARLIDVESRIIVGTARTTLARRDLGEAARRALEERPRPHLAEITSEVAFEESWSDPEDEVLASHQADPFVPEAVEPGMPGGLDHQAVVEEGVDAAVTPVSSAALAAHGTTWTSGPRRVVTPGEAWKAARRRAALRALRETDKGK